MTLAVAVSLPPLPSLTVRVAVYGPAEPYVCEAVMPLPVAPSPKFHEYVNGSELGSVLPEPEKFTVNGAAPDVGFADATALGAALPPAVYWTLRTSPLPIVR
jgi:hypothetical protein